MRGKLGGITWHEPRHLQNPMLILAGLENPREQCSGMSGFVTDIVTFSALDALIGQSSSVPSMVSPSADLSQLVLG